jgi:hypothetical protein
MSPELLAEGVLSKAADVFAFGIVLLEVSCCILGFGMLLGRLLPPSDYSRGYA